VSWWSLMLVCAPLELAGGLACGLLWLPAKRSESLDSTRLSLQCLLVRNRRLMNARLRHLKWRCLISGHLLRHWPTLSGRVFKVFYPALLLAIWCGGLTGLFSAFYAVYRMI